MAKNLSFWCGQRDSNSLENNFLIANLNINLRIQPTLSAISAQLEKFKIQKYED